MKKSLFIFVFLLKLSTSLSQENAQCSGLGAWLWYLEITDFDNHQQLADSLVSLGVNRIYIKVADGTNTSNWPEISNQNIVNIYKTRGMQVWAWSYNYPNNYSLQAEALYIAGKTGYEGFVVDVESEFDANPEPLNNLFHAFSNAKNKLITDGFADENFKLYCTTWGNPKDHDFHIGIIDPHVDGYLAQTYVEQWGPTFVDNLEYWIEEGDKEYKMMGATKPVHHILAIEKNSVPANRVDAFFEKAGSESSIWRIPGGGVSGETWNTWSEVNWKMNFCETTLATDSKTILEFFPNPFSDILQIKSGVDTRLNIQIYNNLGQLVYNNSLYAINHIDLTYLESGYYTVHIKAENKLQVFKIIKQ